MTRAFEVGYESGDQNRVELLLCRMGLLRKAADVDEWMFESMDFIRIAAYEYCRLSLKQLRSFVSWLFAGF